MSGARARSRALRVFGLVFAVLQIVSQGAFTVTDGYAERADSSYAPVHADTVGSGHHRFHDADCAICHLIASATEVPPRQAQLPEAVGLIRAVAPMEAGQSASIDAGRPDRARAPPAVE